VNGQVGFLPTSDRVTLCDVDLTRAGEVEQVVARTRPEWVIHLAALHFIPYCNAHPAETLQVNVVGTQHVLDACRKYPPQKLVSASTVAVYPIRDGANAEDDPAGPSDIYGASKWFTEKLVEIFAEQVDTCCAVARLSNVFGPHETNPHVIPEILRQMVGGEEEIALGNVKPKRDFIYVEDVADGLVTLAEKNQKSFRVYNLGNGTEHSVEEIVDMLGRISGQQIRIKIAGDRIRRVERMHLLTDRRRIRDEIGWEPRYTMWSGLEALWRYTCRQAPALVQEG